MKSSARNRWCGTVSRIEGKRFILQCGAHTVHALVPETAAVRLRVGQQAVAMVKASAVMLLADIEPFVLLSENCVCGTVSALECGTVNHVVTLDLGGGQTLSAAITLRSSETLDIRPGQKLTAVFAAEQVMVAVLP